MEHWQDLLCSIIGWIYFAAWSLSFYGQIYQNFKHKSSYGYFVSDTQTGQVELNDVLFGYHALFATFICITQILLFPSGKNKIHWYTVTLLFFMWAFILIYSTLTLKFNVVVDTNFGVFRFMGYFKLAISTLKYLPQMYWNYERKSTKGWSIFNILLDFTGGSLSFLQMALQVIFDPQMKQKINWVKTVLGIAVVFYDIIFIVQHYCLYRNNDKKVLVDERYSQLTDAEGKEINAEDKTLNV